MRQFTSAGPPPQRHECVAFLPFGAHEIKALKIQRIFADPKSLADHLYQHRRKTTLFQREAAAAMNVALHNYIQWERGNCQPCPSDWPKVIAYLGYDPIELDGSFGSQVEALTRRMGVYHRDLAAYLGINRDTLRRWIGGEFHKSNYRSQGAQQKLIELLEQVPD